MNAVDAANVTARTNANAFAPIDWAALAATGIINTTFALLLMTFVNSPVAR